MLRFTVLSIFLLTTICLSIAPNGVAFAQLEPQKEQAIDEALGLGPQYYIPRTGDLLEDTALRYLHACMGRPHKLLSHNQQLELCRCTSENLKTDLTPAQMEVLFDDDAPFAEQSRHDLFTKSMASCLTKPIYDFVLRNCATLETQKRRELGQYNFSSTQSRNTLSREQRRDVCTCSADMTAQYFDIHGATYIQIGMHTAPDTHDPSGEFMASERFLTVTSHYKRRCYQIHVLNWR
ncbi:MAG: hypothetical protein ACK4VI_06805 [Alphaproteobacteria bacterium]